jgi:hypothetical protein
MTERGWRDNDLAGVPMINWRTCTKCEEVRPRHAFSDDRKNRSGKSSWCRRCVRRCAAAAHFGPTDPLDARVASARRRIEEMRDQQAIEALP